MKNLKHGRRPIYIFVGVMIVVVIIVAVVVPVSLRKDNDDDDGGEQTQPKTARVAGTQEATTRHDCYLEAKGNPAMVNVSDCKSRGCIYDVTVAPPCFTMRMTSPFRFEQTVSNDTGIEGFLTSDGPGKDSVNKWILSVEYINDDLLRFSMNSFRQDRYTVPVPLSLHKKQIVQPKYEVHVSGDGDFEMTVIREETGTAIWHFGPLLPQGLILTDQLLQVATTLPSNNIYGLGEHMRRSFRHKLGGTWPSFARDQFPSGADEGNLYGVHPFYTCVEDDKGHTHGVLFMNSNAQEYSLASGPTLTYRTIGGILDFYIFMGPSPEQVVQQYTEVIGRPMMPPYWALGFQLCRYGYMNITNLKDAVDSTRHYGIPQDVQYVDIDHMQDWKDFTIDQTRFPGLDHYFKELQSGGMRIIYLLDPCLVAQDDYEPYRMMKQADGAIKWPKNITVPDNVTDDTGALLGYVWPPAPVIFPDFLKASARDAWKTLIKKHRKTLTFDGLWIDMNEPASFGTNLDRPFNWPEDKKPYWSLHCPSNTLEDPPYRPKAAFRWDEATRKARLSDKTICMSAVQGEQGQYRHYDVHSLYGWSQTKPTLEAAREATGERSVVIARSTFPGSGQWAGHWLGDNASIWPDLHASIIGMLDFNLFGIPYIGADICGFNGDTSESLCLRWSQLGAFYPFSRNHNAINNKAQGPGQLGDDVGKATAEILRIRYRLLPYLYTLFHLAHTAGSTVVRPLHHEFPTDPETLSIDKQFLWGSCFLISPILEYNQTELKYYLPEGRWYNYITHEMKESNLNGRWHVIPVFNDSKPELFIRGGCALVEQEPANNTHYSRQNPLDIVVGLDSNGSAKGFFFWDDGVSIDTYTSGEYFTADIDVQSGSLKVKVPHKTPGAPEWQALKVRTVRVLGLPRDVTKVTFQYAQLYSMTFTYSESQHNLKIEFKNPVPLDNLMDLSWV